MQRLLDEEGVIPRRSYKQIKYVLKCRKPLPEGQVREIPKNLQRAITAKKNAEENKKEEPTATVKVWTPGKNLCSRPEYSLEKTHYMEKLGLSPAYVVQEE